MTNLTRVWSNLNHEDPASGAAVERAEILDLYKWDLERIYPDWETWEQDFATVEAALPGIEARQGSLSGSARNLLEAVEEIMAVRRKLEVVLIYAGMRSDEDTRVNENTARLGRSRTLATRFAEAASWFEAELLTLDPKMLIRFAGEQPGLQLYHHYFENIQRSREHTLDKDREALLASAANMARGASQVYNALNNADLKFPTIIDEGGREVELTKGRYLKYIKSTDRRVRQDAFEAFLDTYSTVINTLAANMSANVQNHVFYSRARKFPGTLDAALHANAIPTEVFHNLLSSVEANLATVYRFVDLKKRVLGLETLHDYDLSVPLFAEAEFKYTYDEAQTLLLNALAPLGKEYVDIVREGFTNGWIDVHESIGKRSGAYSNGVYDTSPYILLNWSDQLGDTFTLAHEMGHSVHTYLTTQSQPYVYGDYPIFTAEVASTCNEMLLSHFLLDQCTDRAQKLYLLDYYLNQINSTVVRQTMLAEFEFRMHRAVEGNQTLTADMLGDLYQEMLLKYWGPQVEFDSQRSPYAWCRVPHFYYNYYVYQYATAYAAATVLSQRILAGSHEARERYLDFLRSGNHRYPVETLELAGVDITRPQPVEEVFVLFTSLIDQVEEEWGEGR